MTQFTFELKQDLFLPATGNPNKGYLYFPKAEFGLSYEVKPNPKKKVLYVTLGVAELSTDDMAWPLTIYAITEHGFPTSQYVNQAEYDVYVAARTAIEVTINTLSSELDTLLATQALIEDTTSQEYLDLQIPIDAKTAEVNVKIEELNALTPVVLETLFINKYDDVINYFKGDGSLTEEGIEWAKTVYYEDYQLGDLII